MHLCAGVPLLSESDCSNLNHLALKTYCEHINIYSITNFFKILSCYSVMKLILIKSMTSELAHTIMPT